MVIALVERGGSVRAFHPARADGVSVNAIVRQNIARESRLHTDESRFYIGVGQEFAAHEAVKHSHGEYVGGDVHTNSVEGFLLAALPADSDFPPPMSAARRETGGYRDTHRVPGSALLDRLITLSAK
jgi:ISXO2-like transposase domain